MTYLVLGTSKLFTSYNFQHPQWTSNLSYRICHPMQKINWLATSRYTISDNHRHWQRPSMTLVGPIVKYPVHNPDQF